MGSCQSKDLDEDFNDSALEKFEYLPMARKQIKEEQTRLIIRITMGEETPTTFCQLCGLLARLCCCFCCWTLCCPPCTPCIIHKIAIGGIKGSTYRFVPTKGGDFRMQLSNDAKRILRLAYYDDREELAIRQSILSKLRCFYVKDKKKRRLACVYCQRGSASGPTVLYSHRRAEDLGFAMESITTFTKILEMDVFTYDYFGCGISDGSKTESNMYASVECAYEYLTKELKVPWQKIIAIGSSLGTAPTIHLASRFPVGGVILIGSFLSIFRKLCNPDQERTCCLDKFVSYDKIQNVHSPTLFVHGEKDELFKLIHMQKLAVRCPGAVGIPPLIVPKRGHDNLQNGKYFWPRLRIFIAQETKVNPNLDIVVTLETISKWAAGEEEEVVSEDESEMSSTTLRSVPTASPVAAK